MNSTLQVLTDQCNVIFTNAALLLEETDRQLYSQPFASVSLQPAQAQEISKLDMKCRKNFELFKLGLCGYMNMDDSGRYELLVQRISNTKWEIENLKEKIGIDRKIQNSNRRVMELIEKTEKQVQKERTNLYKEHQHLRTIQAHQDEVLRALARTSNRHMEGRRKMVELQMFEKEYEVCNNEDQEYKRMADLKNKLIDQIRGERQERATIQAQKLKQAIQLNSNGKQASHVLVALSNKIVEQELIIRTIKEKEKIDIKKSQDLSEPESEQESPIQRKGRSDSRRLSYIGRSSLNPINFQGNSEDKLEERIAMRSAKQSFLDNEQTLMKLKDYQTRLKASQERELQKLLHQKRKRDEDKNVHIQIAKMRQKRQLTEPVRDNQQIVPILKTLNNLKQKTIPNQPVYYPITQHYPQVNPVSNPIRSLPLKNEGTPKSLLQNQRRNSKRQIQSWRPISRTSRLQSYAQTDEKEMERLIKLQQSKRIRTRELQAQRKTVKNSMREVAVQSFEENQKKPSKYPHETVPSESLVLDKSSFKKLPVQSFDGEPVKVTAHRGSVNKYKNPLQKHQLPKEKILSVYMKMMKLQKEIYDSPEKPRKRLKKGKGGIEVHRMSRVQNKKRLNSYQKGTIFERDEYDEETESALNLQGGGSSDGSVPQMHT